MAMFEQPIGKWDQQGVFHTPGSEGSVPQESGKESLPSPAHDQIQPVLGTTEDEDKWPCGDNPSMPGAYGRQPIDIQKGQGDQRNFSGGPKGADPAPAKPGA